MTKSEQQQDFVSSLELVKSTNSSIMQLARQQCRRNIVTLGKLVHTVRTKKELSIRDAAKLAGCSSTYYHAIENGKRIPSRKIAQRIQDRIAATKPAEKS